MAIQKVLGEKIPKELLLERIVEGKIFPNLILELVKEVKIESIMEVKIEKNRIFNENIDRISMNKEIFEFISRHEKNKVFHIWTNSNHSKVEKILALYGCYHKFSTVISLDKALIPKPDLYGLHLIENKHSIKKNNMIVVDDDELNVKALYAGGYLAVHPREFNLS